uniref:Uncharacterized protein n=1 Tax=Lepeophtheirus salmonis TaxID=72036 RepID=A0A0K2U383_LEPSM
MGWKYQQVCSFEVCAIF